MPFTVNYRSGNKGNGNFSYFVCLKHKNDSKGYIISVYW